MIENIDVFDFKLTEDDMEMIAALEKVKAYSSHIMIQKPLNI